LDDRENKRFNYLAVISQRHNGTQHPTVSIKAQSKTMAYCSKSLNQKTKVKQ